jgi:hypothetical protein
MSQGKYLSLEEARKKGNLERFAKEHSSEGDLDAFLGTLERMAKKPESADQTSTRKRCGED